MISSSKVTNRGPNFDQKDFPGEGHLNQDRKDDEALIRQIGMGDSAGRGKSLCKCPVVEEKYLRNEKASEREGKAKKEVKCGIEGDWVGGWGWMAHGQGGC